ncbi:uridine kinase family protein [Pseudonocardia sichuanensis]
MRLYAGEPVAGPWRAVPVAQVLDLLGRPRVLAVDGRSGGGKTTVAHRLAAAVAGATVLHTDDVAWYHAFFDWAELIRDGVLVPLQAGHDVRFRPPAWDERGREGAITACAASPLVVVEGVGIGRRELADHVDALLWVQTDADEARRRGLVRDGADAAGFWAEWQAAEDPFQAVNRPWERAGLVVSGAPQVPHDPHRELVVAHRWA